MVKSMTWHNLTGEEALRRLHSDGRQGLSEVQAKERLARYGPNRLAAKKPKGLLRRFLAQFQDFMVLVLLAAAGVSFVISRIRGDGDFIDSIIILAIVVVNALVGMIQESRAEKAIEALEKLSTPHAHVVRGGKLRRVESDRLVPGDLVQLETGDLVPADIRILRSQSCRAEESALTGESLPAAKDGGAVVPGEATVGDRKNMLFSGSSVVDGRAFGVVVATGMQTQMGRIAGMIAHEEAPQTPLQKKLARTGKVLGLAALGICALIFALGLFQSIEPLEMFMISVSLAVAAIPEGLPAVVTIVLAMGVRRMAARRAIVRRLPAVETLGSASVICSDKTGTLTQNRMTVTKLGDGSAFLPFSGKQAQELLELASLCTNCRTEEGRVIGEPTEAALCTACQVPKEALEARWPREGEIPFSSARKRMATFHRRPGGGYRVIVKGAPDLLVERCSRLRTAAGEFPLTPAWREKLRRMNESMAGEALRVLGVAFRDTDTLPKGEEAETGLTFCGLVGMMDPPRPEAARAVKLCRGAGIRPVMITGDHGATAAAIAKQLGILRKNGKLLTGRQLDAMDSRTLEGEVSACDVFARVSPEHKVRIVRALQAQGQVVAMTGDGVNDAPALRAADIGCAMGKGGTDVARAAADMVLTDDNFSTIVSAVREGRGIYSNIRKTIHFLLSCNIGEILLVLAAFLLNLPTPLLAIQLLWVNLVTDSLPALALGAEPAEKDVMHRKPAPRDSGVFSGGLGASIVVEGCLIGALALLAYTIGRVFFDGPAQAPHVGRTMAFAVLSLSQVAHAFNMRSEHSLFSIGFFSNPKLNLAAAVCILLQVSVIAIPAAAALFRAVPLTGAQWAITASLSLSPVLWVELEKRLFRRQKTGKSRAL
mgnify:FL=1